MDHIPLQLDRGGDKRKTRWREGWGGEGGGRLFGEAINRGTVIIFEEIR